MSFGESSSRPDPFYRDPLGQLRHRDSEWLLKGHEVTIARWGHDSNNIRVVVRVLTDADLNVLKSKWMPPAGPK